MLVCKFYNEVKYHYEDKEFLEIHEPLLDEYEIHGNCRFTTFVLMLRVAVAVPMLVIANQFPAIQSLTFLSMNLTVVIWYILVRPGKSIVKNVVSIFKEAIIVGINIIFVLLAYDPNKSSTLAYVIIAMMMAVYVIEMIVSFITGLIFVYDLIKEWCKSNKEPKIQSSRSLDALENSCSSQRQYRSRNRTLSMQKTGTLDLSESVANASNYELKAGQYP